VLAVVVDEVVVVVVVVAAVVAVAVVVVVVVSVLVVVVVVVVLVVLVVRVLLLLVIVVVVMVVEMVVWVMTVGVLLRSASLPSAAALGGMIRMVAVRAAMLSGWPTRSRVTSATTCSFAVIALSTAAVVLMAYLVFGLSLLSSRFADRTMYIGIRTKFIWLVQV